MKVKDKETEELKRMNSKNGLKAKMEKYLICYDAVSIIKILL